jgi:hypothetical protein
MNNLLEQYEVFPGQGIAAGFRLQLAERCEYYSARLLTFNDLIVSNRRPQT